MFFVSFFFFFNFLCKRGVSDYYYCYYSIREWSWFACAWPLLERAASLFSHSYRPCFLSFAFFSPLFLLALPLFQFSSPLSLPSFVQCIDYGTPAPGHMYGPKGEKDFAKVGHERDDEVQLCVTKARSSLVTRFTCYFCFNPFGRMWPIIPLSSLINSIYTYTTQ